VTTRITRRGFLKTAAAATLATAMLPRLAAPASAEETGVPELPWPYTKLDPEEARKRGHLGYYLFECAGGSFWAIASQLQEKIGHPWTLLPIPSFDKVIEAVKEGKHLVSLFQYGYGGVVGWGTLCGALNGPIFAIQMIVGEHEAWDRLGKALMRLYETTPLPTKKSNDYAVNGQMYVPPEKMKSRKWLPQNVSGSTLCHVSVGKWCEVSGYASGSAERSERCGRLTGDMTAYAVMLLNAYFEAYEQYGDASKAADEAVAVVEEIAKNEYGGTVRLSATTASCRVCHYKGKVYEDGQFTRGFLACESCHRDMRPHAHTFFNPEYAEPAPESETAAQRRLKEAAVVGSLASAAIGAVAGFAAAKASSGSSEIGSKDKRSKVEG